MRVLAPAKINLHLRVGPRREDGFHPLLTWMTTVALFDTLTLVRRSAATTADHDVPRGHDWFALSCDDPFLPRGGENLVVKAAAALADALSRDGEGSTDKIHAVSAFLIKRIPSGAGLGGGSSDAAATIAALNTLWKLNWSASRLSAIGASVGSDVPFFLHGPSSVCRGRGEIVRPVAAPDMKWAVLMLPKIETPTPAVYRRFDEMNLGSAAALDDEPDWSAWAKLTARQLMPVLVNDLEPATFSLRPDLGELRSAAQRELSQVVRMSGSGSSLFSLCDDAEEAQSQARRVRERLKTEALAVSVAQKRCIDLAASLARLERANGAAKLGVRIGRKRRADSLPRATHSATLKL